MLTIFSAPEPFLDKFNTIQRNAIKSWMLINPKPEIILLGKVEGSDIVSKEFDIHYIPDVLHNEFGTPLVNSVFATAQAAANNDLICYVNSDIILTDSVINAIQTAQKFTQDKKFLITGSRWNIYLDRPWNFKKGDLQEGLIKYREYNGYHTDAGEIDYFIFPKSMSWDIPPFVSGRGVWEGWLIYNARKTNIPVIDATGFITAYHQEHKNFYCEQQKEKQQNTEHKNNKKLRGSFTHQYSILDASHILTYQGLKKSDIIRRFLASLIKIKYIVI